MHSGLGKLLEERLHDLITREFYIEHGFAFVDLFERQFAATLIGLVLQGADMVDETSLECAAKDVFLMVY